MTTKLSSEQLQHVLEVVPGTLRSLASERDYWRKEAQARMQRDEATKVAQAMHEKGINSDTPIADLVGQLEKAAEAGKLEMIAASVEMAGPDMGSKIASLTGDGSTRASDGSGNEFERFILGGVG